MLELARLDRLFSAILPLEPLFAAEKSEMDASYCQQKELATSN